jgi:hypothetical protein
MNTWHAQSVIVNVISATSYQLARFLECPKYDLSLHNEVLCSLKRFHLEVSCLGRFF